jgi:ribonuclease R
MIDKETLLDFITQKAEHPMGFRELSERLKLSPPERRVLKRLLRTLTQEGQIIKTRKGLYGSVKEFEFLTGYFEAHREGYGFVVLEQPGQRDIFIPSRATMGAMDNDKVIVRLESQLRREGSIVRILDRAHKRISGIIDKDRSGYFLRPKDPKIPFDLYLGPSDLKGARLGDVVVAEITDYGDRRRPALGKIVKVINRPDNPAADIDALIEELDIPSRYPQKATIEAKELRHKVDLNSRRDLRWLNTFTIDGENARDFDDAVSVTPLGDGYRLWVHIADVSHYVRWDSPIDLEARKRGTSFYFPDRVIHMLPKELSEDLCSLKPRVDRLAMTVELDIDRDGQVIASSFYPSIINSNERLTYTIVRDLIVGADNEAVGDYLYLREDLVRMYELSQRLRQRRKARGSLDFDLPEPEVLLDLKGNPENIIKAERNIAHMLIEDFMIAANEAVARYLEEAQCPAIYRVHELPEKDKIEETFRFLYASGLISDPYQGRAKDLHRFISRISGHPHEELISKHLLRSMKQARYSTDNIGHFGLASEAYTHFTSPIRRYPDLIVHRILKSILLKLPHPLREEEMEGLLSEIAFSSSRMERKADDAERAALDIMRVWFMKDRAGECFDAMVINVAPYGLRVRLKDYYVEGLMHVSYMHDDYYRYDEGSVSLRGSHKKRVFQIGTHLVVRLEAVDHEGREVLFGLP